jgi:hypothetical protein
MLESVLTEECADDQIQPRVSTRVAWVVPEDLLTLRKQQEELC